MRFVEAAKYFLLADEQLTLLDAAENFRADTFHSYKIAGGAGGIGAGASGKGFLAAPAFELQGRELERRSEFVAFLREREFLDGVGRRSGLARDGLHGEVEAPEDLGRLLGTDAPADDAVEDLGDGFLDSCEVFGHREGDLDAIGASGSRVDASVEITEGVVAHGGRLAAFSTRFDVATYRNHGSSRNGFRIHAEFLGVLSSGNFQM